MACANKLAHGSGPSSEYPSSWINLKKHDLDSVLPFVLGADGKSLGGLRRDAIISVEEDVILDLPPSTRRRCALLYVSLFLN